MSVTISSLDRARRRWLFWFAVAFFLWQSPIIVENVLPANPPTWVAGAVALTTVAGMLFWLFAAWRLIRVMQTVDADPSLQSALNDERTRANRDRSIWTGFFVLVAYLAITRALSLMLDLPVQAVLDLGIVLAVVVPIGAWLFRERRDER